MKMNKVLMLVAAMSVATAAVAQDRDWEREYEIWEEGSGFFANKVEMVTKVFDEKLATGGALYSNSPEYFAVSDVDGDGKGELWVRTADKKRGVVFTRRAGNVEVLGVERPGNRLSFPNVEPDSMLWTSFDELTYHIDLKKDITMRHRPVAVFATKQARNTYVTQLENSEAKGFNPKRYDRMIFKPHVGDVTFVKQEQAPNTEITRYTYRLKTASHSKTMFRGYNDNEFTPWLVPAGYLNDHNLLQFSRWKEGEPKRALTRDEKNIVSRYYGGRAIVASQWLASAPDSERSFYAVQFANEGTDALAALVCVAEGEVVSTLNYHGTLHGDDAAQSIWFVDDEGDFMQHVPEIQCMVATDEGLELYIRQFGGESVSYVILREVGRNWVSISRDYEIYVWN